MSAVLLSWTLEGFIVWCKKEKRILLAYISFPQTFAPSHRAQVLI